MKLIILTSIYPSENNGKAGNMTLYEIVKQLLLKNIEIKIIFKPAFKVKTFPDSETNLKKIGTIEIEDYSYIVNKKKINLSFRFLRKLFDTYKNVDDYDFDYSDIVSSIKNFEPNKVIFFWDTILESISSQIKQYDTVYYGAKPPYAAFYNSIKSEKNVLKKLTNYLIFKKKQKRHLSNINNIKKVFNISKLDSLYYNKMKVKCKYLPNTTCDRFTESWRKQKKEIILGNISDLNATGNSQGLNFLNSKIYPHIKTEFENKNKKILISGAGQLNKKFKNILNDNLFVKLGFVKDLDSLVLSSEIFLMLNNFGSYTGGYTRIIYFFSAGGCLIAHKNLKKDMPEVKNNYNCLLANNEFGIVKQLFKALNDSKLRKRIGKNARKTFEQKYLSQKIIKNFF